MTRWLKQLWCKVAHRRHRVRIPETAFPRSYCFRCGRAWKEHD